MLASEAPSPARAEPFWRSVLGSVTVIAAIFLLNVVIDPVGEIGLVKPNRLNRLTPNSVARTIREAQDVSVYRHVIATTRADTFLIGTSREARGFDLCRQPDIVRIASSGWTIREIAAAQALVLGTRTAPARILVELGAANDLGNSRGRNEFANLHAALAPTTTLMSLRTLTANLSLPEDVGAGDAFCRPLTYGPTDWRMARRTFESLPMFDDGPAARRTGGLLLLRMMADADAICAKTGLRHRVVFFALPSALVAPLTRRFVAKMHDAEERTASIVTEAASGAACDFSYLNLSASPPGSGEQNKSWREQTNWTDYNHFSPMLGAIALRTLLKHAHAKQRTDNNISP
jgi:hypothetical protein